MLVADGRHHRDRLAARLAPAFEFGIGKAAVQLRAEQVVRARLGLQRIQKVHHIGRLHLMCAEGLEGLGNHTGVAPLVHLGLSAVARHHRPLPGRNDLRHAVGLLCAANRGGQSGIESGQTFPDPGQWQPDPLWAFCPDQVIPALFDLGAVGGGLLA